MSARRVTVQARIAALEESLIYAECRILELEEQVDEGYKLVRTLQMKMTEKDAEVQRLKNSSVTVDSESEVEMNSSPASSVVTVLEKMRKDMEARFARLETRSEPTVISSGTASNIPAKLVTWPVFDERNVSIWLEKVDGIKESFSMNDRNFITTLKLNADAKLVKKIRSEECKGRELTWLVLREKIKKWYQSENKVKRTIAMYERTQNKNENAFSYICDKLQLVNELMLDASDAEKIELCVSGLQKEEKLAISSKPCSNLDEFLEHVITLDDIIKREKARDKDINVLNTNYQQRKNFKPKSFQKSSNFKPAEKANVTSSNVSNEFICANCWETGHSSKQCQRPRFFAMQQYRSTIEKFSTSAESSACTSEKSNQKN